MVRQSPMDLGIEQPLAFTIVFDGGSLGNPGRGYGSFKIFGTTGEIAHEQLDYNHVSLKMTNNQAEYRTLISALEHLSAILGDRAGRAEVTVNGDSALVINQVQGKWKVRNADLQPLHEQSKNLLRRFGRVKLAWHARSNSVDVLGH